MVRVRLALLVVLVPIGSDRREHVQLLRSQRLFPALAGEPVVALVAFWLAGVCPIA